MSDLFQIMNTAKQSILSHVTAVNVTSGNIANVNTPGYSRLRPVFGSQGAIGEGGVDVQVGVEISAIERIYDRYLDTQIIQQEQQVGESRVRSDMMGQVEEIFNDSSVEGINDLLSEFWNAWSDLSANPDGYEERDALVSLSQSLSQVFRERSQELVDLQGDADNTLASDVQDLNAYMAQMADLNDKIVEAEVSGGTASDLRDKRFELLKTMSGLTGLDYYEASDGSLNVFLANGRSLVEGGRYWALDVVENPANGNFHDIVFQDAPDIAINDQIRAGEIAGLISMRDDLVGGYLEDLDNLARNLVNAVNDQHQSGFDLYGNGGGAFFTSGSGARDMAVDARIAGDSGLIAAAATVNGDGGNAQEINAVRDGLIMEGNTQTAEDFYQSLVVRIGMDVRDASRTLEHQTVIQGQYETRKESISGVSLDEEMMNLIRFQMGYNAAGKLCGVVSEMMDTLISLGNI